MKEPRQFVRRPMLLTTAWIVLGLLTQSTRPLARPQIPSAASFLDLYDRGDYAAVSRSLGIAESRDLNRLDGDLNGTAKSWIQAAPPEHRSHRTFVAGAFALEVTHALTTRKSWLTDQRGDHSANPESLPGIAQLVAGVPRSFDPLYRDWVLAALATWQHWNTSARMYGADSLVTPEPVWALLMGQPQLIDHAKVQDAVGAGGFLGQALQRFPDDPRLRLAEIEAIEAIQTRCTELFCHDEMTPAALNDLRTRANSPGPTNESVGCKNRCWVFGLLRRIHDSAVANLRAFDRLLPVAGEFARLADRYPSVRAEAYVHIGYLGIRAARPDAAIEPLATAATSDDSYVAYLAAHFSGRALEMLERRAEAVAAYRRALAIVPNAPSTATLLAAQLFLSDKTADRAEAQAILEGATAASPRPDDPWDRYWHGDARLWSISMERLRTGLRE
jgi:hypothetical protein